ncbi:DUF4268 domain-containing protein [Massilia soli]|uniref:DUF4268 domain-containing protein n=1 Tax=Massilia soli TaxID=2792854 RepID=A0ABS7SMU3_9BURK|nr:DUF4268 domain-containing protein [Massilia soli]MBZ2207196.1 DUF4268 domain-containing protein [Massilia soli]
MTAYTNMIHIDQDGVSTLLERMPLTQGVAGQYSESWLQRMLFNHPAALPMREIDPHAGTLVPVCMELRTDAGPADILYVTRTGQVVLVETKLWRNAEARREVVAQILDYAKELSMWSYEDLSREAAVASKGGPGYLLNAVRAAHPDLDEVAFIDGINRSLAVGDFILVIAGDGIRTGAEALVSFLERYGHLRFHFALIEVATFRTVDGALMLQPRVLAKTELLRRSVMIVQHGGQMQPFSNDDSEDVKQTELVTAKNAAVAANWAQFWTEFLAVLRLDDQQQAPPVKPAKTTNLALYLPPGPSYAWISPFVAQAQGSAGVFLTFGKALAEGPEWFDCLYDQRDEIEKVLPGLSWEKQADGKVYIQCPPIKVDSLENPETRQRVITYLAQQTNAMVNVFRHRLESLVRQRGLR